MKQGFRAITQVSLAVLLALTLGLVTAVPSIAQESASISPPTEVYDVGSPAAVNTTITWRDAERVVSVVDDGYQLQEDDYSVTTIDADRATLTILNSYLAGNLTAAGDSLALAIEFDTGDPAVFTIVAVRYPAVSPEEAEYDLDNPPDFIKTSIAWGRASGIGIIKEGEDDLRPGVGNDYLVLLNTLLILTDYLEANLKEDGDKLQLSIEFNVGDPARFTVVAVKTHPDLPPNPYAYDLFALADVEISITWHRATAVVSIVDDDGYQLEERGLRRDYAVSETTLTILSSYLKGKLAEEGDTLALTIEFDVGDPITFTIKAVDRAPSIAPERADYDLDNPANAATTITWGTAKNVTSIVDDDDYTLIKDTDYTLGDTILGETTLTILNDYLSDELTDVDQSVELSIKFGFDVEIHPGLQHYATFNITAIGTHPTISPGVAPYDLHSPAAVNTTITWRDAERVVSVVDDGYQLQEDDYSVTAIDANRATLTILSDSYLNRKLRDIGDEAVLTIEFSVGDPVTFTITGVRCPAVYPTAALYDLDNRADFVDTRITWGSASKIERIADDKRDLTPSLNNDYIVLGDTLVITDNYLRELDIGDEAELSIDFDDDYTTAFNIRVIGTHARIFPPYAVYDLDDRADVQTTITWGSATEVVSITENDAENDNRLTPEDDYVVEQTVDGEATLTISEAYLEERLERWVDEVLLTVEFDVGKNAQLLIGTLARCFIATAAYGTAMALEIQVLREFRDGYLLTNSLGQSLVDLYYRISPPIAQFITEHPSLKPIVRAGLVPAVAISTSAVNTSSAEKMAIVGLLVLISVALAVWTTKRRGQGSTV